MRTCIAVLIMISTSFIMAASKNNSLMSIKVIPLPEDKIRIDFHFAKPLIQLPANFITQNPARIVLDFINSDSQLPLEQMTKTIQLDALKAYHAVSIKERVRVILDLKRTITYSGSKAGHIYTLVLNGKTDEIVDLNNKISISNQVVNTTHEINRIDFRGIDKQGGRILLNASDASIPIDVTKTGKKIVINFLNTKIPEQLRKRFDVADFHSPVQLMSMQQSGKNVCMTLVNKGEYSHFVYQVNKQIMIDIIPLTPEEIQKTKLNNHVFSGKKISLNFQNINIRAVLQLLADVTGINMVVSDKVTGDITLSLNDIPWDQALDIILTTQGLDKLETGNVILIDTKKNLDSMEEAKLKNQRIVQKLEPMQADLIQINYAKAPDLAILIKDKQNSLLSKRGKVSVDVRTNTIWIQDTGTKIEEIRKLIKELDIPVRQVLIEARIVEVKKDFAQDIGIRWGVTKPSSLSGTLRGANQMQQGASPPNVAPLRDRLNLDLPAIAANLASPATIGLALAKINDNILLDLELSALESEGFAELISSPRLVTINQQPAIIDSGQEIPYQEATSSGATAVAFKKAVLSLKVTPQITPDHKILMELQINQDTVSNQLFNGVPAILTKELQTNVLVNNGQTIVLGGIYSQDKTKSMNRIPLLGQLPVLGQLFRNTQVGFKNNELLIFITPKIISNALSITTIEGREKDVYK